MKIYIAGPMRGHPKFNFPAFHAKAAELRAEGHEVFDPAQRDLDKYGPAVCDSATGDLKDIVGISFNLREALSADLKWICEEADAIYMLPGWAKSSGAPAERLVGIALGLVIMGSPA